MGRADFYSDGDHNMLCDKCGIKYKRSDLRETWDHQWVCFYDWEERQPQDLLRAIPDNQSIEDPRPEGNTTILSWECSVFVEETLTVSVDVFLDDNEVTVDDLGTGNGIKPVADECAVETLLETITGLTLSETGTSLPLLES